MGYLKTLIVLTFLGCVTCEETLLDPCAHTDSECISLNTEKFLDKTSAGIPQYDIKPIDPLHLRHVDYADPGSDIVMHFRNVKITGFKKLKISNFTMNIESRSVILQAKVDVNIDSDLTVELKQATKFLAGSYNARASNFYLTANYNYDLVPNEDGLVFYEVGPEVISCESAEAPKITLGTEFEKKLNNDLDAAARKADYDTRQAQIRTKAVCEILSKAYAVSIHNIRASAKVLPKTSFFTDV